MDLTLDVNNDIYPLEVSASTHSLSLAGLEQENLMMQGCSFHVPSALETLIQVERNIGELEGYACRSR